MNRTKQPSKPEMPMSRDGRLPEIMLAIMPDYPKWNRLFFQLDCVFAIINFLLACPSLVYLSINGVKQASINVNAILYLLLPSVLN